MNFALEMIQRKFINPLQEILNQRQHRPGDTDSIITVLQHMASDKTSDVNQPLQSKYNN